MKVILFKFLKRITRKFSNKKDLPNEADVVIIGGGVQGISTLYHLQSLGVNAILLERDLLTAGTTWHSAGLVWRLRPSDIDISLINITRDLAKTIEEVIGTSTGWKENGGLFVANGEERLNEYKRLQTIGKYWGIESFILGPLETKEIYPLMNIKDIHGCLFSPGDGSVEPADYTIALSRAAKMKGGKIYENVSVVGFESNKNLLCPSIRTVLTNKGSIYTKHIILCGGVWSRDIGKMTQVNVPLCALKHAYVLTDTIDGISSMPNVRDHDKSVYLRVQGNSLQVGGYEPNPIFWNQVQTDFSFGLFELDWDVFGLNFENGMHRVPILSKIGIKNTVCGPESFTTDHKPLLGEVPNLRGFWLNCGFNSSGLMLSGGCSNQIAEWILNGYTSINMFSYDIKRFNPDYTGNNEWINSSSHESYAKNYSIVFPKDEHLSARILNNKSPFYNKLISMGVYHQSRHQWERPGWVSSHPNPPVLLPYDYYGAYDTIPIHETYEYKDRLLDDYTFDFSSNHHNIGEEVSQARKKSVFYDQSYFGIFFCKGKQAMSALQWICTNNIKQPIGATIYTNMCNLSGHSECDLTVSRIGQKEFFIASGGGSRTHDFFHIRNIIQDTNFDCKMTEETKNFTLLSIQGEDSKKILKKISLSNYFSNEHFPFSKTKIININSYQIRAIRLTFIGELGWELHLPKFCAKEIFELFIESGKEFNLQPSGYRAIDSLSAEKGYLHWQEDIRYYIY